MVGNIGDGNIQLAADFSNLLGALLKELNDLQPLGIRDGLQELRTS